jgi:hypothetical protein
VIEEVEKAENWDDLVTAVSMISRDDVVALIDSLNVRLTAAEKRRFSKTKLLEAAARELWGMS